MQRSLPVTPGDLLTFWCSQLALAASAAGWHQVRHNSEAFCPRVRVSTIETRAARNTSMLATFRGKTRSGHRKSSLAKSLAHHRQQILACRGQRDTILQPRPGHIARDVVAIDQDGERLHHGITLSQLLGEWNPATHRAYASRVGA